MRVGVMISCALLIFIASLHGQEEQADPYSLAVVRGALKMRSGGRKLIMSQTQKYFSRLGDGVSIALLKLLDEKDLANPQIVRDLLPLIGNSFDQPQFISIQSDKEPRITLFLLAWLKQHISDAQVQQDIQQTIEYVKQRTAR